MQQVQFPFKETNRDSIGLTISVLIIATLVTASILYFTTNQQKEKNEQDKY